MTSDEPKKADSRTVTLSARDVVDLRRLLSALSARPKPDPKTDKHGISREKLISRAKESLAARRARAQFFGSDMFGEPAWDILLAIYIAEDEEPPAITQITASSGSPATTTLRWLEYLEKNDLVDRRRHATDGRVVLITLSPKGRDSLDTYFAGILT